ncbi:MAG: hypothetical protein ABSH01_12495 [Terriglobia bacterium]
MGRFDVEAALRRHVVRQVADKIAAASGDVKSPLRGEAVTKAKPRASIKLGLDNIVGGNHGP